VKIHPRTYLRLCSAFSMLGSMKPKLYRTQNVQSQAVCMSDAAARDSRGLGEWNKNGKCDKNTSYFSAGGGVARRLKVSCHQLNETQTSNTILRTISMKLRL